MGWEVRWRVIDGPEGERDAGDRSAVLQNETVEFSLESTRDAPMRQMTDASRAATWAERFTLQVVGEDTGTRGAPVTAPEARPLRLRYRFQWTGPKRIHFTGEPNTTVPTFNPYTRHAVTSHEAAFPAVDLHMRLEVLSEEAYTRRFGARSLDPSAAETPLGRAAATSAGATPRYRRTERAREDREEAEAEAEVSELADLRAAREALLEARGSGERRGLLVMDGDFLTDAQIEDMTRGEAEDYLVRFDNAYRATPVLDLNTRRVPAGPGQEVEMMWVIDGAGGRDVMLYQRPTHFYRLGRSVVPTDLEGYAAEVRERSAIRFASDAWLVVILPGETRRALVTGSQLLSHEWDRLTGMLTVVAELVVFEVVVLRPLGLLLRGLLRAARFLGRTAAVHGLLGRAGMRILGEGASAGRVVEGGGSASRALERSSAAGRAGEGATSAERVATRATETSPTSASETAAAGAEARATDAAARGTGAAARAAEGSALSAEGGEAALRVRIADRLQTAVTRQNRRLAEAIRNRDEAFLRSLGLRTPTIRILVDRVRIGYAPAWGRALERLLARSLRTDPELTGYFEFIGSRRGVAVHGTGRPDWRGRGFFEGWLMDLTTTADRTAHVERYYGEHMMVLTYDRLIPPL